MVLHVSRTGKSSKDMASDWEVSWQAWENHYKIMKTILEFETPKQSYSTRKENQPWIGKRFTRVTGIATRRSDSSKPNEIPMVLHGSQDRKVVQRPGIRSWSWLGSVTKSLQHRGNRAEMWNATVKLLQAYGKFTPNIKESYNRVTGIAIPRSDSSKTNEIPIVLHVSRTGKSSKDIASDWEVSWQAWRNHYKIVRKPSRN